MFPTHLVLLGANSVTVSLKQFVSEEKIHPILVNFTAALVPVSLASNVLAGVVRKDSLRATGWWTMCFAALITPLTAVAGWLFWMSDDQGVRNMTIHKWLGTTLAVVIVGLAVWRWWFYRRSQRPHWTYLLAALLIVAALVYQGHLGGEQSFGSMDEAARIEHTPANAAGHHGSRLNNIDAKDRIHEAVA